MSVLSEKLLSFFSHYKCIQCSPENLSENPHCSKRLKPFPPWVLLLLFNLLLPTIQTKNSPLSRFPFLSFLPVFFSGCQNPRRFLFILIKSEWRLQNVLELERIHQQGIKADIHILKERLTDTKSTQWGRYPPLPLHPADLLPSPPSARLPGSFTSGGSPPVFC